MNKLWKLFVRFSVSKSLLNIYWQFGAACWIRVNAPAPKCLHSGETKKNDQFTNNGCVTWLKMMY